MIDPMTVAVGTVVTSAIGAGFNIYQVKKNEELKNSIKKQRIELLCIEGCGLAALLASFIDNRIWKKKLAQMQETSASRIYHLENEVADLTRRVEALNLSALNAKIDTVIAEVATPKIVPVPEMIVKQSENEKPAED